MTALAPDHLRPYEAGDARDDVDRDMVLAAAFLRASRSRVADVVAVSGRLFMTTSGAATYLGAVEHLWLWRWARAHWSGGAAMLPVEGRTPVKVRCEPVVDGPALVGLLLELEAPLPPTGHGTAEHEQLFASALPGASRQASELRARLGRVAESDAPTLITGESGTGKTTIGRRLLELDRTGGPTHLFDAAEVDDPAWLEQVCAALEQGTVLLTHLDQLADRLAPAILAAIARGGPGCRVIATAGPAGLGSGANHLFAHQVELPPLRERLEDLPAIATQVMARQSHAGRGKRLDPGVRRQLWSYQWPRNITELEQVLHRAALVAPTSVVDETCLRVPASRVGRAGARRRSLVEAAELDSLLDALDRCGGNKVAAADMLGISRSTLYRKARALGV